MSNTKKIIAKKTKKDEENYLLKRHCSGDYIKTVSGQPIRSN